MTGDEMQRAIEFLLKSQANSELRFEQSNQLWDVRFEESDLRWNKRFEELDRSVNKRFEESDLRWNKRFEELDRSVNKRFEESDLRWNKRFDETNLQIEKTNQVVEALAETQAEFTQTMLDFITLQTEFNTWTRNKLGELTEAQLNIRIEISDLTKAVNNLVRFSSGNGNLPPE